MVKLPQVYIALEGERYGHVVTVRMPEVLTSLLDELLPTLRPHGFKSESDLIRSAILEFLDKYKDLSDNPNSITLLTSANYLNQKRQEQAILEKSITETALTRIREFLNLGMTEAADKVYLQTMASTYEVADPDIRELLQRKIKIAAASMMPVLPEVLDGN